MSMNSRQFPFALDTLIHLPRQVRRGVVHRPSSRGSLYGALVGASYVLSCACTCGIGPQ